MARQMYQSAAEGPRVSPGKIEFLLGRGRGKPPGKLPPRHGLKTQDDVEGRDQGDAIYREGVQLGRKAEERMPEALA